MISRLRAKFLSVQILLLVGVLVAFGGLLLAAKVVFDSSTGANEASAYHEVQAIPADADQIVEWTKDAWTRQRQLEPATRTSLTAGYVRAWAALGRFESTGDTAALNDTFSGPARQVALQMPRSGQVATWDTSHRLQLTFYALDGATAAFTDGDAEVVRTVAQTGGGETVVLSREQYDVVMVLEDGYWRVRQLRRLAQPSVLTLGSAAGGAAVTVSGGSSVPARPLPAVRATEYRLAAWTPAGVVAAGPDLDRAKALGLTTLRVPLPVSVFGEGAARQPALKAVPALLSAAQRRGLTVEPVLFDGIPDLSPGNWSAADHEVSTIVAAAGASPALLLWDLLDDPLSHAGTATRTEVAAFLVHETQVLQSAAARATSAAPVTIGWPDAASALTPDVETLVNVVTLAVPSGTPTASELSAARAAAGSKPVMLVTPGPASDGGWGPFPRTEKRQAATLAAELSAVRSSGMTAFSAAALLDSASDGRGLLRGDGSTKPAAALVAPGAEFDAVPEPGLRDVLTGRFYRLAGLALIVGILLLARWLLLGRRPRRGRHRKPGEPPVWPPPGPAE